MFLTKGFFALDWAKSLAQAEDLMNDASSNSEVCQSVSDFRHGLISDDFSKFIHDVQNQSPWAIQTD
jgi:hypothetical protein